MAAANQHLRQDDIEKLNGTNYQSWKYNIKLVLMGRGLFSIVDGTEKAPEIKEEDKDKPESVKELKEWRLRSDKAYTTIALNIEKSLQVHISRTTDAHKAWDILSKQFEVVSVSQIVRLFRRFYAAEMKEEEDLQTFITKMTSLAQDLREMNEDISSKKFATVILGCLPPSYQNFVTSFNTQSIDDLCWDNVRGLLHEEYLKRKELAERNDSNYQHTTTASANNEQALFTGGGGGRGIFRGAGMFRGAGSFRGNMGAARGGGAGNFRAGNNVVRGGGGFRGGSSRGRGASHNNQGQRYNPYNNSNSSNRNFQGSCYNCGENGHKSVNCPQGNDQDQGLFVADDAGNQQQPSSNQNNFFHEDDLALNTEFSADVDQSQQLKDAFQEGDAALSMECQSEVPNAFSKQQSDCWYIDSAATRHMTYDRDILMDFRPFSEEEKKNSKVKLGNDYVIPAVGEGKVRLATSPNGDGQHLALEKVTLVPRLTKNLLSVAAMTENGAEVRFDAEKCVVVKNNKHYNIGHKKGKLYCVGSPQYSVDSACFSSNTSESNASKDMWHWRFGHLNKNDVDQLVKSCMVEGMIFADSLQQKDSICEGCVLGKMAKIPFPKKSMNRASIPLELVHTDLCGPMQVPSHGGSKYVLTFTDDYSRYTTVYFLKNKSDTILKFKEYVKLMETYSGQKVKNLNIKTLRSDNGGEYTSNEFDTFCKEHGIQRQFSNSYSPEQNGVAERFNRTMIEAARSMLYHAHLPMKFWAEAVNTAVYIRNRSPTTSVKDKTPYECWFNAKPNVSHFRVFGSQCYVHVPDDQRQKLDAKSYKGIFVGYPEGTKGYKVYNISTGKFTKTRQVIFDENKFHNFETSPPKLAEIVNIVLPFDDDIQEELSIEDEVVVPPVPEQTILNDQPPVPELAPQPPAPQLPLPPVQAQPEPAIASTYEETFMNQVNNLGTRRVRNAPKRFDDECHFSKSTTDNIEIPKTFNSALHSDHCAQWEHAMKDEYNSLIKNKTWRLVPRPRDKNVVQNRWVYNIKRNEKGEIDRFKARLVAKGYTQTEGVDYSEVFSPVARFPSIRTLLAFANAYDLEIHHMDVATAFLNGDLDCEIYMEQPKGFIDPEHPDYVCLLDKSLYGLKQSARCWNATLDGYLKSCDYRQSSADECIYIKTVKEDDGKISFVILGVYVDDIIPISNNTEMLLSEKQNICNQYEMVDNGEISYCLGLSIKRDRVNKVLTISQPNYVEDVLVKFGMQNCRPVATPLEPGVKYYKTTEDDELCDVQTYQQAIGSLTYAAICTRPDISAAVGVLSQFMSNPNSTHWTGV